MATEATTCQKGAGRCTQRGVWVWGWDERTGKNVEAAVCCSSKVSKPWIASVHGTLA